MKKKLLAFTFIIFVYNSFAQLPEDLLDNVRQNYTNEKIYFHYDKQHYLAGETVWFKAYLMQGFLPATTSTSIKVTLHNDEGKLIDSKILPIVSGTLAIGTFVLPATLKSGSYNIIAHTAQMKNFGSENFYTNSFNVYNPASPKVTDQGKDSVSIYFLPEGGNMIADISNHVAFKCADKWGYPKEVSGTITDTQGKTITTFNSTHDGMGIVEFTPQFGEKYMASYSIANGIIRNMTLPSVQQEGVKLHVERRDGKIFFEIDKSTVTNERLMPEYLLGVEENSIALKAPLISSSTKITGALPLQNLETGILQLTVFNKMHQPLAERIVFINKEDYSINANFKIDTINLSARQKNVFSFILPDTIKGSYSVAVTDRGQYEMNNKNTENIFSRFLITNQLKGYIYNTAYYLETNDEIHKQNLDLVMLTSGWRRYSWDEILNNKLPKNSYSENSFITIDGIVKNKTTGAMMGNTEITAIIKTKKEEVEPMEFVNVRSKDDGSFSLPSLLFQDTAKISFMNSVPTADPLKFELKPILLQTNLSVNDYKSKASKYEAPADELMALLNKDTGTFENGITLNTIFLTSFSKKTALKTEEKYATTTFGGIANTTLDFIKNPPPSAGLNILEYLKSRLPGVNISGKPGSYSITLRTIINLTGGVPNVTVFIDGVPADPEQASTYSLNDIALVQLYSTSARAGIGGALVLYTKKQSDREGKVSIDRGEMFLIEGFSPVKEFYSPNYLLPQDASILNDKRSTLYWDPYLTSDGKSNKVSFSFYNSDVAKKFNIIIEGLTKDGKFLHIERVVE